MSRAGWQVTAFTGAALAVLTAAQAAHASSGVVTGTVVFFQNQGNYCPATRDCTGANYPQSQYQTYLPLADTKIFVRRTSDNAVIGQGSTNTAGVFTIAWTDPAALGHTSGHLLWTAEHKDGRFAVRNSVGGVIPYTTANRALLANNVTAVGTWVWSGPGLLDPISNVYDGAYRMWAFALSQSTRMSLFFGGVQIFAFDSDTCPTSCADGPANRIILDDFAAYAPQARIMHEMGHIASYRASRDQRFQQTGNCEFYSYPSTTCSPTAGWTLESPEWEAAAFEEALATHLADVALYRPSARQPHSCISSDACGDDSFNVETAPICGPDQQRVVLNHMRYLWDNYDTRVDYPGETLARPVSDVLETIFAFANGLDNRQKNEPFFVFFGFFIPDETDGRSTTDYRANMAMALGIESGVQLANNCGAAGD